MAQPNNTLRFGPFEADLRELELRRRGVRQKLQDQPFQVLAILLKRAGETVTREDLRAEVWPADTFVDFDHSLNTAINKIREVLGDSASSPHYVETVPKRGYRFIALVEAVNGSNQALAPTVPVEKLDNAPDQAVTEPPPDPDINQLPSAARGILRSIFGLVQIMYLIFYIAALFKIERIHRVLEIYSAGSAQFIFVVVVLTAVLGIPTRLYLLSSVAFDYKGLGVKFARIFPAIVIADFLWALAPFLMVYTIGAGLALAAMAALLYLPFSQRTLIRMAYGNS